MASTRTSRASASQSTRNSRTFRTCPLDSPFLPKLIARAAEKHHFAGSLSLRQRDGVHEAEHEHVAGSVVLNDGGNQSASFFESQCSRIPLCVPLANQRPKNKKPAGAYCASGSMSALCCETLCTPHRARRVAVMMMVAMCPRVHTNKIKENRVQCQQRLFCAIVSLLFLNA